MDSYDANVPPDHETWLMLDDFHKCTMVEEFHIRAGEPEPEGGFEIHALYHVQVENQVALGTEGVGDAISRLTRQGLSRHESVHAAGAVLADMVFAVVRDHAEFDLHEYKRRLDRLTAKRWQKGKW